MIVERSRPRVEIEEVEIASKLIAERTRKVIAEHHDAVLGPQPPPAVHVETWREEYRPITETVEVSGTHRRHD